MAGAGRRGQRSILDAVPAFVVPDDVLRAYEKVDLRGQLSGVGERTLIAEGISTNSITNWHKSDIRLIFLPVGRMSLSSVYARSGA